MCTHPYQSRTNTVKDKKGDVVAADSHSILGRLRNHFCQLVNIRVQGINDIRQIEIQTAEPLVSEPSAFEVEMTIE